MTPDQITIVQKSFQTVFLQKAEIANAFYEHLFDAMPSARDMFQNDMQQQKEMFATMLVMTVRLLNRQDELEEVVKRLVHVHGRFEVTKSQFAIAGGSILLALRDVLAEDFTPQVEEAWQQATQELVSRVAAMLPD